MLGEESIGVVVELDGAWISLYFIDLIVCIHGVLSKFQMRNLYGDFKVKCPSPLLDFKTYPNPPIPLPEHPPIPELEILPISGLEIPPIPTQEISTLESYSLRNHI